jgi:hypothetical protein
MDCPIEVSYDTSVGVGPIGLRVPLGDARSPTWMSLDNNIRSKADCNSLPILGPNRQDLGSGNLLENWYVNETDRGSIHPSQVLQSNLKGQDLWNNLSFVDPQKVTTKETTEYAYAGNATREDLGSTFWTYADGLKVTNKETTEYAYAGNATREDLGSKFWTYADDLKVTTKETTEYAYAGNPQRSGALETQREQYTNPDKAMGGAKTVTIRGSTLVNNWMAPSGRQNLRQDAEFLMGKFNPGTFGDDENYDGPGTLRQALPDGSRYQYKNILATPRGNPNRDFGVDSRNVAVYQVEQLTKNPLSIYTKEPNAPIPSFECYVQPQDFSPVKATEGLNLLGGTLRTPQGDDANAKLLYAKSGTYKENPLMGTGIKGNDNPVGEAYAGKCYSGDFTGGRISLGGPGEPSVYGPTFSMETLYPNMAQGIPNRALQASQAYQNPKPVEVPNPALSFVLV